MQIEYPYFTRVPLFTFYLDRILHHSTTINIKGNSYRLEEKVKADDMGDVREIMTFSIRLQ